MFSIFQQKFKLAIPGTSGLKILCDHSVGNTILVWNWYRIKNLIQIYCYFWCCESPNPLLCGNNTPENTIHWNIVVLTLFHCIYCVLGWCYHVFVNLLFGKLEPLFNYVACETIAWATGHFNLFRNPHCKWWNEYGSALQNLKAVTTSFSSKQLLPFDFAEQIVCRIVAPITVHCMISYCQPWHWKIITCSCRNSHLYNRNWCI